MTEEGLRQDVIFGPMLVVMWLTMAVWFYMYSQRIPYLVVVGDREVEQEQIAVRSLGGEDLGAIAVDEFVRMVKQ